MFILQYSFVQSQKISSFCLKKVYLRLTTRHADKAKHLSNAALGTDIPMILFKSCCNSSSAFDTLDSWPLRIHRRCQRLLLLLLLLCQDPKSRFVLDPPTTFTPICRCCAVLIAGCLAVVVSPHNALRLFLLKCHFNPCTNRLYVIL